MKRFLALILSLSMALALAACGGGNQPAAEPDSTGSAAETTSGNTAEPAAEGSTELNIYMWQQYISEQLVADFEEANNCTVNISYMSDNADAVTRLTAGGGDQYDLIMTCDAYMESLIAGGYVEKLDNELDTLEKEMAQYKEQDEDVLTYALFPQVAMDFFKYRDAQKTKVDEKMGDKEHGAYPV